MNRYQEDIRRFHKEVLDGPTSPAEPKIRNGDLRASLILEEAMETAVALVGLERAGQLLLAVNGKMAAEIRADPKRAEPSLIEALDGIVDTIVVCLGTAEDIGVDLDPFWDEVQKSNMAKAGGEVRSDGKKLKPPGWQPPNIKRVLDNARYEWLSNEVKCAVDDGRISPLTREQKISWVYGNCKLSNPNVTWEMVEKAVDAAAVAVPVDGVCTRCRRPNWTDARRMEPGLCRREAFPHSTTWRNECERVAGL